MKIELNISGKMEIQMEGETVTGIRVKLEQTNDPFQISLFQTSRTVRFEKPTEADVYNYFRNTYNMNVQRATDESGKFWRFYESKGWKVGKAPMQNWMAAAGNWVTSSKVDIKTNDTDF